LDDGMDIRHINVAGDKGAAYIVDQNEDRLAALGFFIVIHARDYSIGVGFEAGKNIPDVRRQADSL
jgi:hypothetical protein